MGPLDRIMKRERLFKKKSIENRKKKQETPKIIRKFSESSFPKNNKLNEKSRVGVIVKSEEKEKTLLTTTTTTIAPIDSYELDNDILL